MDKLEWNNNALSLMEYIGIIESIYIPDSLLSRKSG